MISLFFYRILNELDQEGKCGKAPSLAKKIMEALRKPKVIKNLSKTNPKDLFTLLLTVDDPKLLKLITDFVNEIASAKTKTCRLPQRGGFKSKSMPRKSKSKSTPRKSKSKSTPRKSKSKSARKSKQVECHRKKIATVMGEFKRGKLRSGSGKKVMNRSQAIAIALNVADKRC
jgi:hypothetical protein